MVGEIQDGETAEIAVPTANTVTLCSAHTNDAPARSRAFDMGMEPSLWLMVLRR